MKKKLVSIMLVVVMGLVFLAVGTLKATQKRADAPAEINIDNKGYKKNTYGAVKFSHQKHQDEYKDPKGQPIACTECHHDYDKKGKNLWKDTDPVKKCVECHDPNKSDGNKKKLQLAFHSDCKDCHKDVVKAGITKDAPYKKCADCMGSKI